MYGAVRRLPKPRHLRQRAGQRCAGGQALWRAGAGQGPHCAAGRAFGSRRQGRLEAWLRAFDEKPKFVFVNHGEDAVAEHWANHLKEEGYEADAPYNGSIWIAAEGRVACAEVGNTRKIIKTKSAETVRTSAAYDRLANMGQRLLEVIRHNQGGANKDLAKFASQIAALCDKWDR